MMYSNEGFLPASCVIGKGARWRGPGEHTGSHSVNKRSCLDRAVGHKLSKIFDPRTNMLHHKLSNRWYFLEITRWEISPYRVHVLLVTTTNSRVGSSQFPFIMATRRGSIENHHEGIMVFRPTVEEFKDFSGYVKKMEAAGAHKVGVAKVWLEFSRVHFGSFPFM